MAFDGLGIVVDPELNNAPSKSARVVSPPDSPTRVAVIPTNEELAIAREAATLLTDRSDSWILPTLYIEPHRRPLSPRRTLSPVLRSTCRPGSKSGEGARVHA